MGIWKQFTMATIVSSAAMLLAGCPAIPIDPNPNPGGETPQQQYDRGYDTGFARNDYYWTGFADSYDTVDGGDLYYAGSDIPYVENPPYDAGFYDGLWQAYNDGYFVAYDYAFTIGFSEGYDVAHGPGGYAFVQADQHIEWLDGGFSDGYNDGFSEGRVFGAYDWQAGIPFDWFDAMLDYRAGTDLTVGAVSTGNAGPVYLYEYGTDPYDLIYGKSAKTIRVPRGEVPAIRKSAGAEKRAENEKQSTGVSYRNLPADVRSNLSVTPAASERGEGATLRLKTSWLSRVEAYRAALNSKAIAVTPRTDR